MNKEEVKEYPAEFNELLDSIDKAHSLKSLADTEGGKVLLEGLATDCTSLIGKILSQYRDASHIELITTCARLETTYNMYLALKRANKNHESLKKILEEAAL